MKFSLSWLKDYIDVTMDPADLAEALTMAGLEVDSVADRYAYLSGVIVGRVEEGPVEAGRGDPSGQGDGHRGPRRGADEDVEVAGGEALEVLLEGGQAAHLVHGAGDPAAAEAEADLADLLVDLGAGCRGLMKPAMWCDSARPGLGFR